MYQDSRITKMARIINQVSLYYRREIADRIQNKKGVSYQAIIQELKLAESLDLSKSTISRKVKRIERKAS